jgi:hypothetical protein
LNTTGRRTGKERALARNNYKFEKRRKELARQKKQEKKRLRRQQKRDYPVGDSEATNDTESDGAAESGEESGAATDE